MLHTHFASIYSIKQLLKKILLIPTVFCWNTTRRMVNMRLHWSVVYIKSKTSDSTTQLQVYKRVLMTRVAQKVTCEYHTWAWFRLVCVNRLLVSPNTRVEHTNINVNSWIYTVGCYAQYKLWICTNYGFNLHKFRLQLSWLHWTFEETSLMMNPFMNGLLYLPKYYGIKYIINYVPICE